LPCPPSYDLVAHLEFSVGNIRSNIKLTDVHTRTRTKRASAPPSPGRRRPDRRFPPCGNRPTPGRLAPFGVVRGEPGASLVGRVQGSDLPGQIVITRPGGELVQAHGHTPERQFRPPRRSRPPGGTSRQWAPMSTALRSLDSLRACLGVRVRRGMWRVLSWEVGVVERRSEEQGVEAASSATQLAVRQSVVPLLRQPHPPRPRTELCLFSGRIASCGMVWAIPERRAQAAMLRVGVRCAALARSARSVR